MYVPVNVSLSPEQVRSLASGKSVRLSRQAVLGGPHKVYMPQTTAASLLGKQGGSLKLSTTALAHNQKQGGSFLNFLKNAAKTVARVALPFASAAVGSRLGPQIGGIAHQLGDAGLSALGAGVRRPARKPTKPKAKPKSKTGRGGVAGWGRT